MGKSSVAFFKPYQGKGAAAIFEYSPPGKNRAGKATKGGMFITIMPELGERKFDSQNKLVVSVGVSDFGDFLAVLTGRKAGLGQFKDNKWSGIYHDVKGKHSSSIGLTEKEDQNGYYFSIGRKVGTDVKRLSIGLTVPEACTLLEFFRINSWVFFEDKYQPKDNNAATPPAKDPNAPASDIPF